MALLIGIAVVAQNAHIKSGIRTASYSVGQKIGIEPVKSGAPVSVTPRPSVPKNGDNPNVVNIITLGTSANGYGYGYWGGQKTMVWADDSLKAIINLHRLGPGASPPSFSGYLGVDLGVNMAQQTTDWTLNNQIYGAFLNAGGTYYLDAARYPAGGIYARNGSTSMNDAYAVYFAPNLSNDGNWGGYSYGRTNLTNLADSTKHLYWYTPPVFTYIPDGFTITNKGVTLVSDIEQEWAGTTLVGYTGNLLVDRGVWNSSTNDFDYELNAAVACPTTDNNRPSTTRIAASPDGQTVWMSTLSNNGGTVQIGPVGNYYPILFQSNDGGITWSDPIAIQLDGPDGIPGIVDKLLSDYRITQVFAEPYPTREEIAYTTAFDCDLAVDKWGNPHIGVVIGIASDQTAYSILTGNPGDSILGVYDIYSTDKGLTWQGIRMGIAQTFRGYYSSDQVIYEDNRVNVAITEAGDKVFLTWLDTQTGGTDNVEPDVYARGFDLVTNMITHNHSGDDDCDNVTFLSDVTMQAWFETTSYNVFTDGNKCIIPIVTELLSDPTDLTQPVTFKYVTDFSYTAPDDYTISTGNPGFPVGIKKNNPNVASVAIFPNPVRDQATISLGLAQGGNVSVEVSNTVGQIVLTRNLGMVNAGSHRFTLDAANLKAGVYFCSVIVNGARYSTKLVVE